MATDQDKESNHYEDQDCSPESLIKHPLQVQLSQLCHHGTPIGAGAGAYRIDRLRLQQNCPAPQHWVTVNGTPEVNKEPVSSKGQCVNQSV